MPTRNKNFTGRDELLRELHADVRSHITAVVPHALHGIGGVGKTHVAIEYAWRYRHEYDIVWWIPADQPILVRSSLAGLAPHLGLASPASVGIEEASAAVLDALRRGDPYTRWLLIFDNADQPAEINEMLPSGGPGQVLITSRDHTWQARAATVVVDVFTRQESIDFLRKRVSAAIPDADASRLAEALGDLPLALEQAGALQAETGMSVQEYERLLNVQAAHLLGANKPPDYPLSMTAAWSLSVSQLAEKLPVALELLRCCAFFGPEPIPRMVFESLTESQLAKSKLRALLSDPIMLSKAIGVLARFALIRIDADTRTILVHRLVQTLLRSELSAEERTSFRAEAHRLLAAASPDKADDNATWPRYAELLGHVGPSELSESTEPEIRHFALSIVRFLFSSGEPKSALDLVRKFIAAWATDDKPPTKDVLEARRHHGTILFQLGDYKQAFELNRETLALMRDILGPDDNETLALTNVHGADFRARGDFTTALEHDLESLRQHEAKFQDPPSQRTLRAMNNLAVDYLLLGDYAKAREHYERTIRLSRTVNANQKSLLIWKSGLARVVCLSGDYATACDIGEAAHADAVADLGPNHPTTLRILSDLSIAKRRAGMIDEAYELAELAFERQQGSFGRDHPDSLAAALCLANAQRTRGETAEALVRLRDTAVRFPDVYGERHPFKYGCDTNLALLLRVNGDVAAARDLDRQCLEGLADALGHDHHYALTCAINLASDLATLGDIGAARELGEQTLATLREALGPEHPLTLACAANLILDLRSQEDVEEAEILERDTFERYERVLGHDHPDVRVAHDRQRLDFDFDPPPL
ncbi:hypothetical protein Acor_33070 [Acrocarpospora corrugata]|uniref:DUF7779 domain-containing protein n=1 Tax=Acrocarpospora corrugata TaxID=35763 RepID=A0A5M3W1Q1_9ACTN|nr:FxSxx-COOH system tetratricopeptide repeat protein [Acrocarpospora corrugata]GES01243.1 hypothetical protein Acor_33070 [Acrocarpospora corrugata]